MKRYLLLLLLLNSWQKPVIAVPVVPNFSSGTMSAVTRTTQNVTETIVSTDFNTGHTYSINGTNFLLMARPFHLRQQRRAKRSTE